MAVIISDLIRRQAGVPSSFLVGSPSRVSEQKSPQVYFLLFEMRTKVSSQEVQKAVDLVLLHHKSPFTRRQSYQMGR